ncbi:centrosomal protein of 72 kDa isoform X2 [Hemicordylus capensis]|uniref:centrosomal protein of 72 kDa isoform X2 n=1 Tax=Hemicordylus capensis TaxID=884348 RepID=UPI0023040014|nr:centrosomal protein of 72 kDa isoform X2 [Hemicordylus capensis]
MTLAPKTDVRSLSLPGTYHEKITHLGNSLKHFINLKSLDLSRNALTVLEGLQHLTCLEKLNLYFNCISSLSEVFRLHSLMTLKDVDLRLNPVVKNESDYRLFVVHMLPNLRQLDNRPVRDSERKASLLHFTTDHAYELKNSSVIPKGTETGRCIQPRAEYINSMSRKCSVMDEDDESVLNLIAKCEWDLRNPLGVTGSTKRDPAVEFHNLSRTCKMEDNPGRCRKLETQFAALQKLKQENLSKDACADTYLLLKAPETDKECKNFPKSPALLVVHHGIGQGREKRKSDIKIKFLDPKMQELSKRDPNLMFHDEAEAYEKIATSAHFTPHPASPVDKPLVPSVKTMGHDQKGHGPEKQRLSSKDEPHRATQVTKKVLYEATPIDHLLDLVDKYWNGYRSLHCNKAFLSQAEAVLSAIQKSVPTDQQKDSPLHQELNNLLLEKKVLQAQLSEQAEKYSAKINSLVSELDSTKKDMDVLRQHLDRLLEENAVLKAYHSKAEQNGQNAAQPKIIELQNQNQLLTNTNLNLEQRLQHFDKMQELTAMLQESHRTLVSTNQHLLQELDETHSRHKAEVEQLHWNYAQLKKITDTLPSS